MPTVDALVLAEKVARLAKAREWSPQVIANLEALIHAPDDVTLVRVNPMGFARDHGITPAESLELFLHATLVGLFTMDWHLLCPSCGSAVESFASLRKLHRHLFCAMCVIQSEANLDDYIQVSFTIARAVRKIRFHDPTSLTADDFLRHYRFTREMHVNSLDGPRVGEMIAAHLSVLTWVKPGERLEFAVDLVEGMFSASEMQAHAGAWGSVKPEASAHRIDFVIGESTLTATTETLVPGRVEGTVENRRSVPVLFVFAVKPKEVVDSGGVLKTVIEPIVTGAMLLANQTFRRLFRNETIPSDEGVGVRDVTVLFTDLKGSTALYERIGDFKAFSLVQQHFDRLGAAVQTNSGAIVKTIGDAVMAAFTKPADAVRAAIDMLAQIGRFNSEHDTRDIVLKIGIHRGPSIAVTLNENLDYFGQTVNIAARVQGLADADEIFLTDDVYRGEGVAPLVRVVASEDAQLRGVHHEVRVHRAVPA
jgi:class 3 adenylate cyclase